MLEEEGPTQHALAVKTRWTTTPGVDDEQIELRALTVMALFEGLGSVSAFRPELVIHNSKFRQQLIDLANAIVRGD